MKSTFRPTLLAGAAALALAVAACHGPGRDREPVLVVGAILPLSGDDAAAGADVLSGMQLAARAIPSPHVELQPTDGAGEPVASARRLTQLVADRTVSAVVAGYRAATARPLASLASRDGIPLLSLSPMALPSLKADPGMRVTHHLEALAIAAAGWARDARAASTAGVFRDEGSEASRRLADAFADEFVARGGELAWTIGPDDDGNPVAPSGPQEAVDVVFVGGPGAVAEAISRFGPATARAAYLITTGWGTVEAPPAGLELYETAFYWAEDEAEPMSRFRDACTAAGVEPNADRVAGWDAVLALARAGHDGGVSRAGVDRSLRAGEAIEGASGRLALRGGVETPVLFERKGDTLLALGRFGARSTVPDP